MGDTDRGLFQQLQLGSALYNDGIARDWSDLLWIDLIADGKYELHIFILRHRSYDSAEDIRLAVQNGPHRSVDKWRSRYSLPGKIHFLPALAIVEWTGVMELGRPMGTFKVEGSWDLGN